MESGVEPLAAFAQKTPNPFPIFSGELPPVSLAGANLPSFLKPARKKIFFFGAFLPGTFTEKRKVDSQLFSRDGQRGFNKILLNVPLFQAGANIPPVLVPTSFFQSFFGFFRDFGRGGPKGP